MDLIQIEKNGIVYVTVKDKTNTEITLEIEAAIQQMVENGKKRLLFDLGAVEYLRSSVLRVILRAVKEVKQKHGKVVLCSLNRYVKEIFEANCPNTCIPISESVESGLNLLIGPLEAA